MGILGSEEGQRVLGQTATGLFPLIHSQLFPFTNETYPSVLSVPPNEFLDGDQCHLEFLKSNLCVPIGDLQVGFPEGVLLDFGEFAIPVRAIEDVGRLREEYLGIRLAPRLPRPGVCLEFDQMRLRNARARSDDGYVWEAQRGFADRGSSW